MADTRELRVELWRMGCDLGLAWLTHGDERQKRLFGERRGTGAGQAVRQIMGADLLDRVGGGEFIALGYRTDPAVSDGPVTIPADLFHARISEEWGEGTVLSAGWRYERVRVVTRDQFDEFGSRSSESVNTERASQPPRPEAPEHPHDRSEQQSLSRNKKSGRRNTYDLCAEVFDFWAKTEASLLTLSAEQLEKQFKHDYDAIHREVAKFTPAPKARTLRKKLAQYRSANIGRNRQE